MEGRRWRCRFQRAVIYQDHVYCCGRTYGNDLLFVLDLKTGAINLHQTSARGATCASPIVADGKIFTLENGGLAAFKTTPDKVEPVGSMPLAKLASCSSPAVADGKLYVRLAESIACYSLTGDK